MGCGGIFKVVRDCASAREYSRGERLDSANSRRKAHFVKKEAETNLQPSIVAFPLEVRANLRFNTHAATSVFDVCIAGPSTSLSQVQVAQRVKPHSSTAAS